MKAQLVGGSFVGYILKAAKELNTGNPLSSWVESLNLVPSDYKTSVLTIRPHCLHQMIDNFIFFTQPIKIISNRYRQT